MTVGEEKIFFHSEDTPFELLKTDRISQWIEQVILQENHQLNQLNFIFCSDKYLLQINLSYLKHDTFTDIITFPYAEPPLVEGDIFLSVDRVTENAQTFEVSFEEELYRVLIHGVLHLCGYLDKTDEQKKLMREKENEAIKLFFDRFLPEN